MPIDRHTSGDEFDRNDDARVERNRVECNGVENTGVENTGAALGAGTSDGNLNRTLEHAVDHALRDEHALKWRPARQAGQGIIWSLLALGLAACGGGGGGGGGGPVTSADPAAADPAPPPFNLEETITVAGGRIVGGTVYGVRPDGTRGEEIGKTDANGEVTLNPAQRRQYVRVEVDLKDARDRDTEVEFTGGTMYSLARGNVVSIITTVMQQNINAAETDPDESTDAQSATNEMLTKIFGADSGITKEDIQNIRNYGFLPEGDEGSEKAGQIEQMSIRMLASLQQQLPQAQAEGQPVPEPTSVQVTNAVNALFNAVKNSATPENPVASNNEAVDGILAKDDPAVERARAQALENAGDPNVAGTVSISGQMKVGATLTAKLTDPNGVPGDDDDDAFIYQWQSRIGEGNWSPIEHPASGEGETSVTGDAGKTLTLTEDHGGQQIRVVVTYTDGGGNAEQTATSTARTLPANSAGSVTVRQNVNGSLEVTGITDPNSVTGENAQGKVSLGSATYQWQADGVDIAGATGATFDLTAQHAGQAITVVVSYTDNSGFTDNVTVMAGTVHDATGSGTGGGRAGAPSIENFNNGLDSIALDAAVTHVYAQVVGENTVLYNGPPATNNVLAVITGFTATKQNFTVTDFAGSTVTAVTFNWPVITVGADQKQTNEHVILKVTGLTVVDPEDVAPADDNSDGMPDSRVTYSWEESTDGTDGSWTTIPGAAGPTYETGVDGYFRVTVTYTDNVGFTYNFQKTFRIHAAKPDGNTDPRNGTDGILDVFKTDDAPNGYRAELLPLIKDFNFFDGDQIQIVGDKNRDIFVMYDINLKDSNNDKSDNIYILTLFELNSVFAGLASVRTSIVSKHDQVATFHRELVKADVLPAGTKWVLYHFFATEPGNQSQLGHDGVIDAFVNTAFNEGPGRVHIGKDHAERVTGFNPVEGDHVIIHLATQKATILAVQNGDDVNLYLGNASDTAQLVMVLKDYDMAAAGKALTSAMFRTRIAKNGESSYQVGNITLITRVTDDGTITDTHDGGLAAANAMTGTANRKDVFIIDGTGSVRADADTITGFEDGRDQIRVKVNANNGDFAVDGNQISWRTSGQEVIIYAGAGADPAKILAVISGFTGTFDAADLALVEIGDGTDAAANRLMGTNRADRFLIDAQISDAAGADVITGFQVGSDKITFSDNSITAVYARVVGSDTRLYSTEASARAGNDANILAVIDGVQVTSSDFTTDDFDGSIVTTVEVL